MALVGSPLFHCRIARVCRVARRSRDEFSCRRLFVVELDDMVIDVDDDGVKDCYFEVVRSELLDEWERVKARYAKINL